MKSRFVEHLLLSLCLFVIVPVAIARESHNYEKEYLMSPDFAFPRKVIKNADSELEKSLNNGDDVAALRALIDLTIAHGLIDVESLPSDYQKISDVRERMKSPGSKILTYLLQAKILSKIFHQASLSSDNLQPPVTPLPDNWTEWSHEQFQMEINRLLDKTFCDKDFLAGEDISKYSSVITYTDEVPIYYPSLLDFASYQAIDILLETYFPRGELPAALLNSIPTADSTPLSAYRDPVQSKILGYYSDLMRYNKDKYASYLHAFVECMKYIDKNIFYEQEELKKGYSHELITKLYEKYLPVTEYAGDLLIDCYDYMSFEYDDSDIDIKQRMFDLSQNYIRRYPNFWRIGNIKGIVNSLAKPGASVSLFDCAAPGVPFKLSVSLQNTVEAYVKIFRLKQTDSPKNKKAELASTTPVVQKKIECTGKIPYNYYERVSLVLDDPGLYYAYVTLDADDIPDNSLFNNLDNDNYISSSSNSNGAKIRCTSVGIRAINDSSPYIFSFDPATGQPKGGVELTVTSDPTIHLGTTDENGVIRLKWDKAWPKTLNITPKSGEDTYGEPIEIKIPKQRSENHDSYYNLTFTDLPLYQPGDTVRWETIVYQVSSKKAENHIVENLKLKAYLNNHNYIVVDSLDVITDSFGRSTGLFKIPNNELTGSYNLSFKMTDGDEEMSDLHDLSQKWFTVSDYKMPTFMIELQQPRLNMPMAGDVTIEGRVVSYSGHGLSDAEIKLSAHSMNYSQGYYAPFGKFFFADTVKTSHNGAFALTIPAIAFDYCDYPDGRFQCDVTATTLSGESQTAKIVSSRKKSYLISAKLTNSISTDLVFDKSQPVEVSIEVKDTDNKPVNTMVRLSVQEYWGKEKYSIVLPVGESKIDLKSLESDTYYSFKFTLDDTEAKAAPTTISYVTLFDPNGKESPSKRGIWGCNPISNTRLKRGEKATLYYAVPSDNSYFLYTLTSGGKVIESRWMKADAGVHKMSVALPEGAERARVIMQSFDDFSDSREYFDLELGKDELKLQCESFRDKLIPGGKETWSFRTMDDSGKPLRAAMIMTLYNEALNELKSMSYNHSFNQYTEASFWIDFAKSSSYQSFTAPLSKNKYLLYKSPGLKDYSIPEINFNTYDFSIVPPMYLNKWTWSDELFIVHAIGAPPPPKETEPEKFQYRKSYIPAAFFQPSLTTDDKGELEYCFTVPDANTSWRLNLFAFTDSLLSTSMTRTFSANKPVMVAPNLPRFLRSGDKADITALVINNSDKIQVIKTQCQLFNVETDRIIHQSLSTDTIEAGGNCSVTFRVDTPTDSPVIGIRFKSSTDQFSDGEQSLIEILPANQPVIETKPFYISSDLTHFELAIPKCGKDTRVTLEYWNSPTWYILTALPGLRSGNMSTSIDAANAIFSASVAEGLCRKYPDIRGTLSQWIEKNPHESTLVSMLKRNADLKTVLLQATPWMVDAMNNTERMQRLSMLLDNSEIESNIRVSIDMLHRLQRDKGGWAWFSNNEQSSIWATQEILMMLGRLNSVGYLPQNHSLLTMINEALLWYETEITQQYKTYPSQSYLNSLMIFDQWPEFKLSKPSKKILDKEIKKIENNWRHYSIENKADAALILSHKGKIKLAKTILQSIFEHAKSTPEQGMWWPSASDILTSAKVLLTTQEITPDSPYINPIRQWLLLQKEACNFGSESAASEVIYAILTSGKVPTVSPADSIGYYRTDITEVAAMGATLNIENKAGNPTWGAIYYQSNQEMRDIESAECEAVSIEKRFYRKDGDRWIAADTFNIGDQVKIQLLVRANRDMQYVAVTDNRAACFEPVEQLSKPIYSQGVCFYRENRDASTNMFVNNLPKGIYTLEYDMWVNNAGTFSSGIATIQSQYAPQLTAHSAGTLLDVISPITSSLIK